MGSDADPEPEPSAEHGWESGFDGAEWIDTRSGSGSLTRAEAQRDGLVRRWDVLTPSATIIGRADSPENDLSENVRRLHDEQHPATKGHSTRTHYLDRLRTTHALCNALDLTPWQRDRALGVMEDLDLTAFGSQRAIPKVALVVIRHIVDVERRSYLGLDDLDARAITESRLEELFGQYKANDITDEPAFRRLAAQHDLDTTSLNRLRRTLKTQLGEGIGATPYGRNPHRDPNLPSVRDANETPDEPNERNPNE
ncbi:DNA-directed RNA polymerase subunit epsilon [Halalkalicoccus subterraneus]|uniref:DNA-directed RNA polymerase subunit epsilon n=1 Tax=Halalkalicoccus subterraneus TaxID=2675002 RepID=UPI000EFA9DED|nr:DNA-directed RNA polymerase subunit epsilon [Halalkalicoccus subterraneus]